MSDDMLVEATRALRETTAGADECARLTRARVLGAVREQNRSRRKLTLVLVPIAAVLVGSTAWASANGRLPELVREVKSAVGLSTDTGDSSSDATQSKRRSALGKAGISPARALASRETARSSPAIELESDAKPASAPEAPAPVADAPAPAAPIAPSEPKARSLPSSGSAHPGSATSKAPSEQAAVAEPPAKASTSAEKAPSADPNDELYRAAHAAHFKRRDFSGALGAWDAYLAAAPRGRFAPEARYNRALCLIRLGRSGEARSALEPFARGAYGTYRRDEAAALLEAMK
jgi:hypothetical protein